MIAQKIQIWHEKYGHHADTKIFSAKDIGYWFSLSLQQTCVDLHNCGFLWNADLKFMYY
jgi:hypothetical protein